MNNQEQQTKPDGGASASTVGLAACPCGGTPTDLGLAKDRSEKWCMAIPNCCGEWMIEFRANYATGEKLEMLAVAAWNAAPRAANV